jgi:hypothetical protein
VTRRLAVVVLAVLAVTAAPASAATSADQRLAQTGVLQPSDFPAGWQQSARSPDSDAVVDRQAGKITSCQAFTAFAAANKKNPRARSRTFGLGQSDVTNTVSVYPTTAKAQAAVAIFRNATLPQCLDRLFTVVFKQQLAKNQAVAKQLQSVTTDIALEAGIRLGDDAVAYQGTVNVGLKNGTTQTIGLGFITVRVGTALAGYSYTTDTDISAALQPAIVASVTRLQRAAPSA